MTPPPKGESQPAHTYAPSVPLCPHAPGPVLPVGPIRSEWAGHQAAIWCTRNSTYTLLASRSYTQYRYAHFMACVLYGPWPIAP